MEFISVPFLKSPGRGPHGGGRAHI